MLKKFVSMMLCLMIVLSVAVVSFSGVSAADDNVLRIKCKDGFYTANVGDKITFAVDVTAERLFENVQADIYYDSQYLKVVPVVSDDPDYEDWEIATMKYIPNLLSTGTGVLNLNMENVIKFNASGVAGYNFKEKKTLVFVEFTVENSGETEIELNMIGMRIKGGNESYFDRENTTAIVTDGIKLDVYITGAEEYTPAVPTYPSYPYYGEDATPEEAPGEFPDGSEILYVFTEKGVYEVPVGQKFRYDIMLKADRLFENIQVHIDYSGDKLQVTKLSSPDPDLSDWEYQSLISCPNLPNSVLNVGFENQVKFNAVRIAGYDFKEEKSLVSLEFTAVAGGIADIDFNIIEMSINDDECYFVNSKPLTTKGISIYGVTDARPAENPPERPTEPAMTYPTVEGDVVVHFDNAFNFKEVYCYSFVVGEDREDLGPWPGTPCELDENGVWTVTIPGDCTHVMFNDGDHISTYPLQNPLEERIAMRAGFTSYLVEGKRIWSYTWYGYDPNATEPTETDPSYTEPEAGYYPTYNPSDDPWYDDVVPGDTVPGEWYPDCTLPVWDYDQSETYPPTETVPCATEGVLATEGDVVVKPQGKPDTPHSQEPKPTQGATSDKEISGDQPADAPATGVSATAVLPVMLITLAGVLLIFRKRETE